MESKTFANPELRQIPKMIICGISMEMSLAHNRTAELWKQFMAAILSKGISKPAEMISLQIYPDDYFSTFNPNASFKKYATAEKKYLDDVPEEFNTLTIPSDLYAVFHYKGLNTDPSIFQYIYQQWLPRSGYQLDNRPHFEILGNKYKNGDSESEEDIYIPVKFLV